MDFPNFKDFFARYDEKKLSEIGNELAHYIYLEDDSFESMKQFAYALYASAVSKSFMHIFMVLEDYHNWLKEQLSNQESS